MALPAYGIFNASALALARANRWELLLWSKDGRDWQRRATADSIAAHATRSLRGGDVILLHDADHYSAPGSWRQTIAALPRIIEAIDDQRPGRNSDSGRLAALRLAGRSETCSGPCADRE